MKKPVFASVSGRLAGMATLGLVISVCMLTEARAQYYHPYPSPWRGDIRRFHEHDWRVWHSGHWVQGRHGGRFGWWWVAGGVWYFYPAPVYPYPDPYVPPPAVMAVPPVETSPPPPPPAQYWYFCEAANAYYPYVANCPGGWKQVPATPQAGAPEQPK